MSDFLLTRFKISAHSLNLMLPLPMYHSPYIHISILWVLPYAPKRIIVGNINSFRFLIDKSGLTIDKMYVLRDDSYILYTQSYLWLSILYSNKALQFFLVVETFGILWPTFSQPIWLVCLMPDINWILVNGKWNTCEI